MGLLFFFPYANLLCRINLLLAAPEKRFAPASV
jgi:hypothetical protein